MPGTGPPWVTGVVTWFGPDAPSAPSTTVLAVPCNAATSGFSAAETIGPMVLPRIPPSVPVRVNVACIEAEPAKPAAE